MNKLLNILLIGLGVILIAMITVNMLVSHQRYEMLNSQPTSSIRSSSVCQSGSMIVYEDGSATCTIRIK